jgi:hypothetical protein
MASLIKFAPRALRLIGRLSGPSTRAPLAPPRNRFERVLAFVTHWGFNVSLAITALLFAGLLATSSGGTWLNSARLALGVILLLEGFLLAKNWRSARRLALWRLQRRRLATGVVANSLRRRLATPFFEPALQLLGLLWLASGLLTVALTLQHLI